MVQAGSRRSDLRARAPLVFCAHDRWRGSTPIGECRAAADAAQASTSRRPLRATPAGSDAAAHARRNPLRAERPSSRTCGTETERAPCVSRSAIPGDESSSSPARWRRCGRARIPSVTPARCCNGKAGALTARLARFELVVLDELGYCRSPARVASCCSTSSASARFWCSAGASNQRGNCLSPRADR